MSTLLAVYLGSLLFGGFFVGMSVLGGMHAGHGALDHADGALSGLGHGADALHGLDGHADLGSMLALPHGMHLDMSTEVHALPAGDFQADHVAQLVPPHEEGAADQASAAFLPFLSLRFWTFGSCFFGLTGTLLTLLGAGPILSVVFSAGMGVATGTIATTVIHRLSAQEVSSAVSVRDYPGTIGRVTVAIEPGNPGKIRCSLRGQLVDLVSESFEKASLPVGQQVLVIDYKDGTARVVHAGRLARLAAAPRKEDAEDE